MAVRSSRVPGGIGRRRGGALESGGPRRFRAGTDPNAAANGRAVLPGQTADNDLLIVNDSITPAVGEVTHLTGRILDARGEPLRNATVEIWQVDGRGAYLHTGSSNREQRDGHFQGFGRFLTGSRGEYYFRTVKPVPYPGRTPHIHFAVKLKGREDFTTQCYVRGHPGNERDFILRNIRDERARESVLVDFAPVEGSKIGELAAQFDIVLGFTPAG
jgi:protocatechuate 3,4-dioxygenase, beta subunit